MDKESKKLKKEFEESGFGTFVPQEKEFITKKQVYQENCDSVLYDPDDPEVMGLNSEFFTEVERNKSSWDEPYLQDPMFM